MKEQIRSNGTMKQFSNENLLTSRPFPPTLKSEGNIFMAEPGNGEGQKEGVSQQQQPIEKVTPVGPIPSEKISTPEEMWDKWEKGYLEEQGRTELTFEERQVKQAGIEAKRPPFVAGAVDLPPEEDPRRRVNELVGIVESGRPGRYKEIDDIIDVQNSNDQEYGQFIGAVTQSLINNIEAKKDNNAETSRDTINTIEYLFEYATERILSRADVNPKAQYPQFGFYENINLDSIISMARIYDHTMERPEGAPGTTFKYLDDLRDRRRLMHELFRNMKDRRTYVSLITQNLRKEGLAFVEKEIAGVADSQIIYEKFLGSALSQKEGWLTSDDIADVDRDVDGFMTRNEEQFSKEIKDENGNVIESRPLRPWEIRRAAIVGKSLNAAMQRRLSYTVLGDVPSDDIDTLLDSVDSEELARILAPMKLITERFLGIDTNTRKIFIQELLSKTKDLASRAEEMGGVHNQYFGYLSRNDKGEIILDEEGKEIRRGLYNKRENSWAILDTGITDPKSNGWRGRKMFLRQKDYQTETRNGDKFAIEDYLDQEKSDARRDTKKRIIREHFGISDKERIKEILDHPETNKSMNKSIDEILDDRKRGYHNAFIAGFNLRIRDTLQRQRLFLGPLLQMTSDLNVESKEIIWNNVAELLPSRIAAFFPDETLDIIRGVGVLPDTQQQQGGAESDELPPPPVPGEPAPDELVPAPVSQPTPEERWNALRDKLFLAESMRVKHDAEVIKGRTWDEVERLGNENEDQKLHDLEFYLDKLKFTREEKEIVRNITNLGKRKTKENPDGKAQELAKIKFPYTPFLDDVPKTDWENIEDFSYDRILVSDHSDFQEGYSAVIGLMAKPVTRPEQVIEAFVKANEKIQNPLGLKGGSQVVLEKYISAYLSMARENEMSKIFGLVMQVRRIPRSLLEKGNLQAKIAQNEDFQSKVLDGLAQQDVISDDPAEIDKNGMTQHGRMRKENKADAKWKLYYWIRLIAMLLGPIAGAEIAKTLLPREAAEQVIAGF